jgi:hypothetical protein
MRVRVYVDGFNLYYRALRKTEFKWLDPLALARILLDPDDTIDCIRYFTARISSRSGDPGAPARQQAYLSALQTIPQINIHYGRFIAKTKVRPLVEDISTYVEVHDTEEKGSDVNLATYLVHDGWSDLYDAALVMSQDTDLCEPIRLVRDDLQRRVGIAWLDGREPGRRLRSVASFIRHVTPARLAAAQLPDPIMGNRGHLIRRPEGW